MEIGCQLERNAIRLVGVKSDIQCLHAVQMSFNESTMAVSGSAVSVKGPHF
jgi:hypothetical protein